MVAQNTCTRIKYKKSFIELYFQFANVVDQKKIIKQIHLSMSFHRRWPQSSRRGLSCRTIKKKTFFESFLVHMCAVISQLPSSIRAMVNSAKGRGSLALKVRELRFRRDTWRRGTQKYFARVAKNLTSPFMKS